MDTLKLMIFSVIYSLFFPVVNLLETFLHIWVQTDEKCGKLTVSFDIWKAFDRIRNVLMFGILELVKILVLQYTYWLLHIHSWFAEGRVKHSSSCRWLSSAFHCFYAGILQGYVIIAALFLLHINDLLLIMGSVYDITVVESYVSHLVLTAKRSGTKERSL